MHEVKIYKSAQQDLKDIVEHLNTLSSVAAINYYDLFIEKINGLSEMPKRFSLARDIQLRLRGYRCMPVKKYIVFYTVTESLVQVRRILYGARQYEDLL